jgi:DNA-binding beta-propeller fold protein YncE
MLTEYSDSSGEKGLAMIPLRRAHVLIATVLCAGALAAAHAVAMLGNTAYVVSTISGTVLPVGRGQPISVGQYSYPTTLTLAGATAVVLDTYSGQVSLVDTGVRKAFAPIRVGNFPVAVAISG